MPVDSPSVLLLAFDEELELPRPFGPYTLVRRLAVGGMAEVYVAKAKGLGGFEKHVAIKVIHPRYSEDDHFIQMLVEEAKISVLLNHVNIAQTFDLGCIEDTYYIVMEFIEGADAYRVMRKATEMKRAIPIDLCVHAAAEVCNGLDYAHRKRDAEGRSLRIVHRDISPQNILVSYAGEVKIVDFGIAKAALRSAQTEVGVIKGKYYYMSPEQAWGDPMDHRSDIFSAGVVLYEMLTGRMLYSEDNVPLLLDKVRKAEIAPPEKRRPSVPKALSDIVMRALRKDPNDRYQSAQEMSQALTQFLYAASPTFTAARLAELMGTLFPNEVQRHSAIVTLPSVEEPLDVPARRELAPEAREKSVLFDLGEDSDESTRNDILPFRRAARAAEAKAAADRETKPAQSGSSDVIQSPARPTFRPARMRDAVDEESTASGGLPVRSDPAGSDKITAPRLGPSGAWVSPVASFDSVTTNPRRAPDDATDDNERAPEWDDPTNLKDEEWDDDHTLVDSSGLAASIDAIAPRAGGRAAEPLIAQSDRGRVNVQWAAKPAARLGRSESLPLPAVANVAPPVISKLPSRPPPPSQAAMRAVGAGAPRPGAAPVPSPPPRSGSSSSQAAQPQPQPRAQPPQSSSSSPGWPAQPQGPPQSSSSSPGWPAQPQPQSASSSPGWAAPPSPQSASSSPGWAAQQPSPQSSSSSSPGWPARPQASPPGPWSGPPGVPPPSGSGFATPAHVTSDPFAPPPPRPAGSTGGFEPVGRAKARRTALYAGAGGLAIAALFAIVAVVAVHSAPAPAIEVISSPTGATVSIDGRPIPGVTPLTAHEGVESGRTYRVEVAMPGYQPWAAQLSPTDGTLRQFVVLAPMPATLRVETDPTGAQVMVNGVLRGEAPQEVTGLVVGQEIEVRALTAGRPPVIRRVRLVEGTTTERISIASQ